MVCKSKYVPEIRVQLLTLWRLDSSFSKKVGAPDNSRPSKDRLRWLLWGDVDPTTIPKEFLWIRFRFWIWFVTRNVGGGGGFEDPVVDWLWRRLVLRKKELNLCFLKHIKGGLIQGLDLYWWNYFNTNIKAEEMTKFDVFHVFVENSVNSDFCFFWALLKPAKIWNLPKNACVRAA